MQGWIATATLAAYAVMGGTKSAVAAATGTSEPARSGGTEATQPVKKFDIDSGPLDETVKEFEETTGLTAKVVLPAGTLAGFSSQGVTGLYREDEALRLLYDLDTAIQRFAVESPGNAAGVQLTGVYHNLLRRWAEI
jgi:catecholate siderophore receptor